MKIIQFHKATAWQCTTLTKIAFAAKRHWNYPEEYYKIWKDELTIIDNYIEQNIVYSATLENQIIGFYSIMNNPSDFYAGKIKVQQGHWLDHFFILPEYHGKKLGTLMLEHCNSICKQLNIKHINIFVDPYAKGFYEKKGAEFLYNSPSSIPGRNIPIYKLNIN